MITTTQPTLDSFRKRIDALVAHHPIVEHNPYTSWFASGDRRGVRCAT